MSILHRSVHDPCMLSSKPRLFWAYLLAVVIRTFLFSCSFSFFSVQTFEQYELDGCDNCEQLLGFRNNAAMIQECTSSSFDG